jgi:predicted alpha/beta superfamily hydrolase
MPARRYPVLYMHDGQNLFDQATSYSGEWHVDETMTALAREGLEAIVVGIPHMNGQRLLEYSPFTDTYHGSGRGKDYLSFVVETVKAMIDRDFRTLPQREHTAMLGSSMGGLITLYALFACGETFSAVGVMSPSFWFANEAIFDYVRASPFVPARVYIDVGTREYGGNSQEKAARRRSRHYYASVRRMKRILVKKGYRPRRDLVAVEDKFAGHNEPAWARRLPDALRFLLAGETNTPDGAPRQSWSLSSQ